MTPVAFLVLGERGYKGAFVDAEKAVEASLANNGLIVPLVSIDTVAQAMANLVNTMAGLPARKDVT